MEIGYEMIKFINLYGNTWAAFRGSRSRCVYREVVFPDGFTPSEGQYYEVVVHPTKTGTFVYNNETFRVSRAKLVNTATPMDEIAQLLKKSSVNTMAAAFASLNM